MGVARADMLIENVPMPELSVAAQIELAGADAADGHADLLQLGPAVDGRDAAGEQRPHPRRIELLVGGNQLFEVGGLERAGHDRQSGARPAAVPRATVFRNSRRSSPRHIRTGTNTSGPRSVL